MGAPFFVPIDEATKDPIFLAMSELASEALPLSIRRSLPNGEYQDIPVRYLLEAPQPRVDESSSDA